MNVYKKCFIAVLGILAVLLSACSLPEAEGPIFASAPHKNEKGYTEFYPAQQFVDLTRLPAGSTLVTSITDDVGDDNGPGGSMSYPITWGFGKSGTGAALHLNDVHNVVVSVDSDNIYFDIAMANITMINEWEDDDDSSLLTFDHLFVGIYLYKGTTGGAVSELVTYAPNDGEDNSLKITCGGSGYDYTIQANGQGGFVGQATGTAKGNVTKLAATKAQLLDNDSGVDSGSVGGLFHSSVVRITVPRTSTSGSQWLVAGNWRFIMVTHDWEDYGQEASIPGGNGHVRQVTATGGVWNYGGFDQSSQSYPRVMDMVGAGPIATNQAATLDSTSASIDGTSWITINISVP